MKTPNHSFRRLHRSVDVWTQNMPRNPGFSFNGDHAIDGHTVPLKDGGWRNT